MPKVLITSDLHLTDNPLEQYRHDFMGGPFLDLIDKHEPDAVLILGDLTEEKDRHSAGLVNRIIEHLRQIADECLLGLLMGNHDYANEGQPFFEFAERIKNIKWIGDPRSSDDLGAAWQDVFPDKPALFLPHTRNHVDAWAKLKKHFKGYSVVFAHNTFEGADTGFKKMEGIPLNYFPKGLPIIAGDIHVPQTLGDLDYVGAPYTVDFGDAYKARVMLYDTVTGKCQSISTADQPQKRLIEIGPDDGINEKGLPNGALIKLRVAVDSMDGWSAVVKEHREWADRRGYKLARIEPIIAHKAAKRRTVIDTTGTDAELIKDFAKRHALTKAQLDAGLDLL